MSQDEIDHGRMDVEVPGMEDAAQTSLKNSSPTDANRNKYGDGSSSHSFVVPASSFEQSHNRRWEIRKVLAILIGVLPVCFLALEMTPERCHFCIQGIHLYAYFITASICGGIAGIIYGPCNTYCSARGVGGAVAALSSLFTTWMLFESIHSDLVFLLVFIGILGAMPGLLAYWLVKILLDGCFSSSSEDDEEDYDILEDEQHVPLKQSS
jgi:hypothetical protein